MPRAKSAQEVQNRFLEAARKGEIDSRVAEAVERLNILFEKIYTNGAASPSVKTVSEEFANLDTWTAGMENLVDEGSKESVAEHANVTLSNLHSSLMEALGSESPEEGKNCYQWLIDEAEKDGIDFVEDMKTLDSITGLGWELEEPEIEEEQDEEEKVEEEKVEEQPQVEQPKAAQEEAEAREAEERENRPESLAQNLSSVAGLIQVKAEALQEDLRDNAKDLVDEDLFYFRGEVGTLIAAQRYMTEHRISSSSEINHSEWMKIQEAGGKLSESDEFKNFFSADNLDSVVQTVGKGENLTGEQIISNFKQAIKPSRVQEGYYYAGMMIDSPLEPVIEYEMSQFGKHRARARANYGMGNTWGNDQQRYNLLSHSLCRVVAAMEIDQGVVDSSVNNRVEELMKMPAYQNMTPEAFLKITGDKDGVYSPERMQENFYRTLGISQPEKKEEVVQKPAEEERNDPAAAYGNIMEQLERDRARAQSAFETYGDHWGVNGSAYPAEGLRHLIAKMEEQNGLTESVPDRLEELATLPGYSEKMTPKAVMDILGDENGLYSPERIRENFYNTLEFPMPEAARENEIGEDFHREAEEDEDEVEENVKEEVKQEVKEEVKQEIKEEVKENVAQNVKEEDKKEVQQQGGDDLTEEDRIKADKRKTAGRLYTKIREMNDRIFDYGLPAQTKLRDVLYNLASYSGDEGYAAAIRQAKKFLTEKIPGSKDTYGDVAEERGILDDDFDELMKHAEQLAAVKTQKKKEPEKKPEKKEPKKEAQEQKKQAQEQKKAPAPEVDEDDKEYDAQEYLFGKMNKYLVDVRGSALKLATNSDDEAARQEYKHNLSRILAFRNEREDWKKRKVLTGADVNNINLKVEQDASLMEESLKFNDIIDGMSGTELFNLVGEMDKLGVNSTTKHPDKIAEGFAKADEAYEASRKDVSNLAPQIEATKSSPLYSKLKSWFVGNSDEYDTALKALKDFGGGKGGKQEAIDSVKQYLDLRGSKVRNTQFGRDRFDGMMKSLATLMNPEEFAKYCKEVDGARLDRDKSYKGVINPYNYLSPEQQKAHDQACLEADKNNKELKFRRDKIIEGFKTINVKKITQSELQDWTEFATEHPSFRKEMQDIFKEKGVKINLPKAPEEPAREMGGNQTEVKTVKDQGQQLGK